MDLVKIVFFLYFSDKNVQWLSCVHDVPVKMVDVLDVAEQRTFILGV